MDACGSFIYLELKVHHCTTAEIAGKMTGWDMVERQLVPYIYKCFIFYDCSLSSSRTWMSFRGPEKESISNLRQWQFFKINSLNYKRTLVSLLLLNSKLLEESQLLSWWRSFHSLWYLIQFRTIGKDKLLVRIILMTSM
jgi:hypothetical protein